jgi:hypothetical protein
MSSLRLVFEAAIKAAFPQCCGGGQELAKLATAVSKALKGLAGYSGA